ncbi:MAG: CDP-glycerol glycerophosphotransferase family protein [Candidatus Cloacimonetes bacterium]|nr:CDP-glycerol glycerophosphotransferase family protein [Candidatus Cloacimonadota bacterium]
MVLSYYLLKVPYIIIKRIYKLFNKNTQIAFYCDNILDFEIFRNINFENTFFIARNVQLKRELEKNYQIEVRLWPQFPDIVIMARHAIHRFPDDKIIRIGMRHGPYHFKDFVSKDKYNMFSAFLMTSEHEVKKAEAVGINNAVNGGFPKIDSLLNNSISDSYLVSVKNKIRIDSNKKTVLFSATWYDSGMSAIALWIDKLHLLTALYNIIVTLHPFTPDRFRRKVEMTKDVYLIKEMSLYPFMLISDILISDKSSLIAEYCVLNKPIITFKIKDSKRENVEINSIIDSVSLRVDTFEDLQETIKSALQRSNWMDDKRRNALTIFFDSIEPNHAKRAKTIIENIIEKRK